MTEKENLNCFVTLSCHYYSQRIHCTIWPTSNGYHTIWHWLWARFYWHNMAMTSGTMCNKLTFCCQTGITHYFQKAFNHFHCITPYPKLDQYYIYIYMYIKRDLQVMFLFHQNFPSLQWWLHSNKHVHTYVYVLTVNKRQTSNILPTSRTMFRLPLRWRFFLLRRDTWSAVCYETCIFNFSPHMNSIFTW